MHQLGLIKNHIDADALQGLLVVSTMARSCSALGLIPGIMTNLKHLVYQVKKRSNTRIACVNNDIGSRLLETMSNGLQKLLSARQNSCLDCYNRYKHNTDFRNEHSINSGWCPTNLDIYEELPVTNYVLCYQPHHQCESRNNSLSRCARIWAGCQPIGKQSTNCRIFDDRKAIDIVGAKNEQRAGILEAK